MSAQEIRDRAAGVVTGCAAGDALGAPYEFKATLDPSVPAEFGKGTFGHGPGEWTDDTSMGVPILQLVASGRSWDEPTTIAYLLDSWSGWAKNAMDVGVQTRNVLEQITSFTEDAAKQVSQKLHEQTRKSAGNGSLMRTGPLALGFLEDGAEPALVAVSGRVAQLTHWDTDNADACALWSLAIRHAVLTGELDVAGQVRWLPAERQMRWRTLIEQGQAAEPQEFAAKNGWVVAAFQAAISSITRGSDLLEVIQLAIHGGHDTDTVAAITGSLAGAVYGQSQLPPQWLEEIHGWPGFSAGDLGRLAMQAVDHYQS